MYVLIVYEYLGYVCVWVGGYARMCLILFEPEISTMRQSRYEFS
jgi:hypothetical protein